MVEVEPIILIVPCHVQDSNSNARVPQVAVRIVMVLVVQGVEFKYQTRMGFFLQISVLTCGHWGVRRGHQTKRP